MKRLAEDDRRQLREGAEPYCSCSLATARANGDQAGNEALRLNEQKRRVLLRRQGSSGNLVAARELIERPMRTDEAKAVRGRTSAQPRRARPVRARLEHARQGRYAEACAAPRERPGRTRRRSGPGSARRSYTAWAAMPMLSPVTRLACSRARCTSGLVQSRASAAKARRFQTRVRGLRSHSGIAIGSTDAYFNRGLARKALTTCRVPRPTSPALEHGRRHATRIFFRPCRGPRAKRGNKAGAASDREEGLKREPVEESCWTARGFAKLETDPKGALADFEKALDRNPRYLPALINKTHVLADVLERPADAVAVLDLAILFHPQQVQLWASRAVYLARLGKREAAHRNAEEALQINADPATRYQIAGVYALTSKDHPEDRQEAFRLLASALKKDYGFEDLDSDRNWPRFAI